LAAPGNPSDVLNLVVLGLVVRLLISAARLGIAKRLDDADCGDRPVDP
jgi:hypothetical protein